MLRVPTKHIHTNAISTFECRMPDRAIRYLTDLIIQLYQCTALFPQNVPWYSTSLQHRHKQNIAKADIPAKSKYLSYASNNQATHMGVPHQMDFAWSKRHINAKLLFFQLPSRSWTRERVIMAYDFIKTFLQRLCHTFPWSNVIHMTHKIRAAFHYIPFTVLRLKFDENHNLALQTPILVPVFLQ